jgi:hypothetical protein
MAISLSGQLSRVSQQLNKSIKRAEKNGDILHFHQFLRATDWPETRIEAQECGHSRIQPSNPKDHSTIIATIHDAVAVAPDCGARRARYAYTLASSSGY